MPNRAAVYHAIDTERTYQDKRWGGHDHDVRKSVGDFVVYMDYYMGLLKKALSTETDPGPALDQLRKVTALGVACMEVHGASRRK